jgi:hypothetical protein
MPKFRYNASGTTRQSIGGDEINYDAAGTVDAATPQEAEAKVRAIKVGRGHRTQTVQVWPER